MHVQSGCSGNDSDVMISSLPCSGSKPADSPRLLMAGLNKHSKQFGSNGLELGGGGAEIKIGSAYFNSLLWK